MRKEWNLTEAEWKLMELLWARAPQTLMQLVHAQKADTSWAKSTVSTLLRRMVEKGAVYYEEGEKAKQYFPAVKREEIAPKETETFLRRMYGGSVGMMLSALVRQEALTAEEIAELKAILEKAEERENA